MIMLPLFIACGGQGDAVFWGFQHANLTVSGDRLSGYQIWELYGEKWERKQKEKHHICSVVQTLTGVETDSEIEGCLSCLAVYEVNLELLESDCDPSISEREDLAGMIRFGIGALPEELEEDAPYSDATLGWYQGWDDASATIHGYAWQDPEPTEPIWGDGAFTLWPAYTWQLD
ncbi:MAG: hypothetical protein ACI8RZ_007465 [Myxococcota bacterium]|jgi:hypothetical protein